MKKQSLRSKLIRIFCITSMIPIMVLSLYSYYNISRTLKNNTRELTNVSLEQIDNNLNIRLEAYEDLLYQIYTDDSMNDWIDKINDNEDVSVTKNQMRRFIQSILNANCYIRTITIITENGTIISYDQLTSTTYENSWLHNFSIKVEELYEQIIADYSTKIYPTEYGTEFASKGYYLMHIAHRIVDYKDLNKKSGIVIISIDEAFLREVCQTGNEQSECFIIDQDGRVISFKEEAAIGTQITSCDANLQERMNDYQSFLLARGEYSKGDTSVYVYEDEELGWDIVNVSDMSSLMSALRQEIIIIIVISLFLLATAICLTTRMAGRLVKSVQKVVDTIQKARDGNLAVRVEYDAKMPIEIEKIAVEFNEMALKLDCAMKKEKEALEKEKQAQIAALEAQINPHFLYNSLDTINWMAIDKEEYAISNAISTLATILSYAIADSNAQVSVKNELDWLRKYVFMQQFRLKNKFECVIDVEPDATEDKIHKMLLQPFVENAIIHGFEGKQESARLYVRVEERGSQLYILIRDNGRGIEQSLVERYNNSFTEPITRDHHLGMRNAITRLRMYYGEESQIHISSQLDRGTDIEILIPLKK